MPLRIAPGDAVMLTPPPGVPTMMSKYVPSDRRYGFDAAPVTENVVVDIAVFPMSAFAS
jgi:hypothetical protein